MQKDQLVFISHSKNDDKIAFALCDYLESNGLQCWIAPRDNFAGKVYGASIIEGINLSKIMIVILSKSSNNSNPVESEVERAYDKKINLMTFKIDKTVISTSLEFFLSSKQWLDASNGNPKNYFPEVLRTCAGLLNDNGVNLITTAPETQNKVETFVKSNTIAVLVSAILGVGFLVYSFVWQRKEVPISINKPAKDTIINPIETGKEHVEEIVNSSVKVNPQTTKKNQNDLVVTSPIKGEEGAEIKNKDVSTKTIAVNEFINVRFNNPKNNDFIIFHESNNGYYSFNGSASKISFSGVAKFDNKSCFKIITNEVIKGSFYLNGNQLTGDLVLLKENFSPNDFLLFKN